MIAFMVLSAPRSASTWAANWLTTDSHLCLHDPVLGTRVEDLDTLPLRSKYGISCTGLPLLINWVNAHACPKLVLHRPLTEVNASLERIGLTPLGRAWDGVLEKLDGWHVHYTDLFKPTCARAIWQHLLPGTPWNGTRHSLLSSMHVDPHFPRVRVDRDRTREFRDQIERALA
jgi:hypothetical protein